MSSVKQNVSRDLYRDVQSLNRSCRRRWGVNAIVFKTVKFVFYIAVLAFSAFVIESTPANATFVMLFATLLITGPEGVEMLLIRQGVANDPDNDD